MYIMLYITHNTHMYTWFQVQQLETSLQQGEKTTILGKNSLFNVFVKTKHFLIHRKQNSHQRIGLNTNPKAECHTLLSHQQDSYFLPCTFPGLCSLCFYFRLIAFGVHCLPPTYDIIQLKCVDS